MNCGDTPEPSSTGMTETHPYRTKKICIMGITLWAWSNRGLTGRNGDEDNLFYVVFPFLVIYGTPYTYLMGQTLASKGYALRAGRRV